MSKSKIGTAMRRFQRDEQPRTVKLASVPLLRARRRGTSIDKRLTRRAPTARHVTDPLARENMRRIRAHEPTIVRVTR